MELCLIVAFDNKYGISKEGIIPWDCPQDRNFFSSVTKNHICIMGKNTWKSLPDRARGLKDRINIVVSSTMTIEELNIDNKTNSVIRLAKNLDQALQLCDLNKKIFICGGKQLYQEALSKHTFNHIYITEIDHNYQCDNYFSHELLQINKFSYGTSRVDNFNSIKITFKEYY